jgi:hypothetical protein
MKRAQTFQYGFETLTQQDNSKIFTQRRYSHFRTRMEVQVLIRWKAEEGK